MIHAAQAVFGLTFAGYTVLVLTERVSIPRRHLAAFLIVATAATYMLPAILTYDQLNPDITNLLYTAQLVREGVFVYEAPSPAGLFPFHPYLPFEMFIAAGAQATHDLSHVPFSIALKFVPIVAVVATGLLLVNRTSAATALAFVFNPLLVAVTAYHGQFDAIPMFLAFSSWWLLQHRRSARMELASALLLGLGVLSKTWPVLLVAPFALSSNRGPAGKVTYAVVALLVPLAASAIYAAALGGSLGELIDDVRDYRSLPGLFGYTVVLFELPGGADALNARMDWVLNEGRALLAGAVLAVTALVALRRFGTARAALTILLTFLAFTPGSVQHYQAWVLPFAAVLQERMMLFVFTVLVTVSMLIHPLYAQDWSISPVSIGDSWYLGAAAWLFTLFWLGRCLFQKPTLDVGARGAG